MDPAYWGAPRPATDAEGRWAAAAEMLQRYPLAGAGDWRPRVRRADRWLAVALVVLAAAVVVAALGLAAYGRPSVPLQRAADAVWAAGLCLQVAGLVVAVRSNARSARAERPVSRLDRAQRRALRDQVRGRTPAEPRRLPLLRWQAEQDALVPLLLAQSCGTAAWVQGLGVGEGTARQIAGVVLAAAVLGGVGWGLVVARQGRRFLVEHPGPAALL